MQRSFCYEMVLKDRGSHPDQRSWIRMQDWFVHGRETEIVTWVWDRDGGGDGQWKW